MNDVTIIDRFLDTFSRYIDSGFGLLSGDVAFLTTVAETKNWFGEFSNVVFRADSHAVLLAPALGGVSFAGLWDLGGFLAASVRAPIFEDKVVDFLCTQIKIEDKTVTRDELFKERGLLAKPTHQNIISRNPTQLSIRKSHFVKTLGRKVTHLNREPFFKVRNHF